MSSAVSYLEQFLASEGLTTNAVNIGIPEIRAFVLYLQQKRRFSGHRYAHPQPEGLSGHTVNSYLRSVRAFWSWLVSEGIITNNPFASIKIPKAPVKIIPTFSISQISALLDAINTKTPEGFRDLVIILTLLDSGLRVTELATLQLDDLHLEEGTLKVMGKGNRERLIPIGKQVRRYLHRYLSYCRPEPASPRFGHVFLTADGRPLTRNRIRCRMAAYGRKADLRGVRVSPHTLRHTAAVTFLRNGGNVFALQRLLGHSSLEMTRHYCELADVDLKTAHATASPVDNIQFITTSVRFQYAVKKGKHA